MKEFTLDLQNYPENAPVFYRTAVRGIVRRGDTYLMIFSRKYGDCKFPGGGMEQGENHTDTLIREMREEAGRDVLPDTVREYAVVHERRMGLTGDVLFMDSYYYFCDVTDDEHAQDLQDYEIDEAYEVRWMTLSDAIARNHRAKHPEKTPWEYREILVMEHLGGTQ